ncbi:hypothetical protein [Burkholderia pseudomallei]|uniref:hypothetical protein n=1 Tax=Burkholderia pseudomallei TaxID=28450 RepID=UPI0034DEA4BA
MTTTHSRADALTDDERIVLKTLANWRGLGNRERSALMKILAAPPVEQPEFTDECADCGCLHPGEYWVHPRVWSGSGMAVDGGKLCLVCLEARLQRRLTVADFPADAAINRCVLWDLSEQPAAAPIYPQGVMDIPPYSPSGSGQSQATSALTWNAPSPADERAASFETWCDRFPEISAVERLRDAWQAARRTTPAMAAEAVAFEITEQAAAEWASRHDVDHVLNHFSTQRNAIEDARTLHLLGASPSSQPAAAPIDEVTCARMGHGVVAIGDCFSPELQEPGIIFMELPEQRDIGLDTGDVFPEGSRAPSDKMLAYISFANPNAIDQTISVLQRIKAKHFPVPSPADEQAVLPEDRIDWIANTHCPGGTAYPVNVKNAIREALREVRISDNETGAQVGQQLSAEIAELKIKLVSYEREREDQIRYLAAQSEEIAGLKQQLAHADARVGLTATVIQKCIDSCAAEYLEDVTGHPEDAAYCQGITDCIDALNRLKTADWSAILAAHSGQSEPETATVARIEQLRKALFESRDAMRVMSNWAKKSDPAGHSWAVRMVDRANAALNGEPEPRSELTVSRCFRCGHADHAGPCVNVHPDLAARAGDAE